MRVPAELENSGPAVMAGFGPRVMLCPEPARGAALEVLYRRVPSVLRDRLIADVLDEARRGEVDLSGLWVARDRAGRILGALLTQPLAGKAAALWAPEVRASWGRARLAAALVEIALVDLTARGFRLVQAVLDESAGPQAARDLTRGGMPRVTELIYLERDTASPLPPGAIGRGSPDPALPAHPPPPASFHWQPYGPEIEAEFRAVLEATYQGSLDMPELEGTRGLEDILDGHRGAGLFAPGHWQLGRIPGEPAAAAVLLMTEVPGRDAWEVIYLGLTPAARGRGLGRAVLRRALELARDHTPRLELAVDLRNTPAVRLYGAAGFTVRDRRAVHLAILGGSGQASAAPPPQT
ncbi:MAG TPA: GNAT family N-acetyltransferase [Isosphaeraceae bacterium]|nr:GNAT family N-acetyltransferase [Isosphaeraceae bacterium]